MFRSKYCCFGFLDAYNHDFFDLLIMIKRKRTLRRLKTKKAHNVGEQDELLAVLTLIFQKTSRKSIPGFPVITSIQTPEGHACKDWQLGPQQPAFLKTLSISKIKKIALQHGFSKSPGRYKADIVINGQGISLKSGRGAPPAIVNHTTRNGWEQACRYMNVSIAPLDEAIDGYWLRQQAGQIKQDIANDHPDSPFKDRQHLLAPMLEYFLFYGSGSGESKVKASKVVKSDDPTDISTWSVLEPVDAINSIWNQLVFSIRSKGMPINYPFMKPEDSGKQESIDRWTRKWQDKYRGSLHVRVKDQRHILRPAT